TGRKTPTGTKNPDGEDRMHPGPKGVMELALVSSGERWGRRPKQDVHSSLKAMTDSPALHLVEALTTLVTPDGNTPVIANYMDKVRPLTANEKQMIAVAAKREDETTRKRTLGI